MTKETGTPQIRFSGYNDTWEQRKVTDLGEIYIGLVTTMTEHYTDKGHLLIRNSDIKDAYFEFGENPIYLDEEFSEQNKSRMHQLGDVITVHTGDIGTSAVIGENEVNSIGFATIVTRPNQDVLDSNYFATYLNTDTHKQWAVSMATGDGRSNYNLKDYTKLVVPVPQMEEQKKIAACVGALNNLITLHQRKYDKLVKVKKSMLEKMFPREGAKVPEIRFYGFTDDWEQRKLGDTNTYYTDGNYGEAYPKPTDMTDSSEGVPFLTGGNLKGGRLDITDASYITKEKHEKLTSGHLVEDDIVIAVRGSLGALGYVNIGNSGWNINSQLAILRTDKTELSGKYLLQFLLSGNGQIELIKRQTGSALKQLPINAIKDVNIPITSIEEQSKIGEYFNSLDHLITLHQRKLEKLKNLKKACLKKMFI